MTRIRTVKPELWADSAFVACSPLARLLWIGIWNHADDYGVVKADAAQLRRQILPDDIVDGQALIDELVAQRLLLSMQAKDGTHVLVVRTWERHQKVDKRSPGKYGMPSSFTDRTAAPPAPAISPPIPPNPALGREGKGVEGKGAFLAPAEAVAVEKHRGGDGLWDAVMEACGVDTSQIPERHRSGYGRAVADLKQVGAAPSEVHRRAQVFRAMWPDATCTPFALSKHWAELSIDVKVAAKRNTAAPTGRSLDAIAKARTG